ncbi:MAG TPA: DnaT-like ssDNA-binding protein [Verrucomicrobiae bacterium]
MALTLIQENGTGKVDANSYATVADGDAYHEGHLYASAWTAATTANKEKALVFATRLIDAEFRFKGVKASSAQALQWPRAECRDPDGADDLASDAVPSAVVNATCELARELLVKDRTAAPAGEGLKYLNVGSTQTGYDKTDTPPVISRVAQAMLAKLGSLLKAKSGAVNLVRV